MSEKYYHGVRVVEEGTGIASPVNGTSGLQVIVGTAPVNLTDDPEASVNVPVLCSNMQDAKKRLGYSTDFEAYTLCQSMYANFIAYGVAPVVFINVLDPAVHKKENEAKEYSVIKGQAVIDDVLGILKSSIVVKLGETALEEDTDYLLSFDSSGHLVITLISDQAAEAKSLMVESTSIDPSQVTAEDIIGGYDVMTGKESGFEVLRQVYPRTGMAPALLLAPGWSHDPEVGAVMISKCEYINGVFSAECLLDLDTTKTRLYTDVPKIKEESGYQDKHALVMWPMTQIGDTKLYYSALFGAMAQYTDASNDNVPSLYLSNKVINIDKAVLADGTEVFMDREQANTLNAAGIITLISEGSWRSWGNNTSVYPEVKDVKDRWIACRRMFTWMSNNLITIYHDRVDSPANYRLIESICDSENIRLNSYVSDGKLAGGRIEYNEDENSVENVLTGQVIFHIYMAAFTPAEDIVFVLKFDPELLADSLSGTGGAS
ncbi:MAG: phage tail sheath family protein [Lachnospiraceae bacterium]|nr:phage tail sheath family protein [Lachnospiraceae bacterium]